MFFDIFGLILLLTCLIGPPGELLVIIVRRWRVIPRNLIFSLRYQADDELGMESGKAWGVEPGKSIWAPTRSMLRGTVWRPRRLESGKGLPSSPILSAVVNAQNFY